MKMDKVESFELAVKDIVGESSEEEKDLIRKQLQANGDFKALYTELETYWKQSEHYNKEFLPDTRKAFKQVVEGLQVQPKTSVRRVVFPKVWKIAASVALVIGLASLLYIKFDPDTIYQLEYTSGDSVKEVLLPDSTIVYLNRESTLLLASNFNKKKRKVELQGEGFFEVSKNAKKPFIIDTKYTNTRVLGTSFNLKEKEKTTTISVYEGRVSFSTPKQSIILSSKNTALYSENKESLKKLDNYNPNSHAWFTKKLIFDNATFNEVIETLSNTYHVEFSLDQNLDLSSIRFAGQYENLACEDVLDIIGLTLNLQFAKTAEQKYHVSPF